MPFAMEVPSPTDPPTDRQVADIVATMRGWRWVSPEQRAALRGAVALLPLVEHPKPAAPAMERQLRVRDVDEILNVSNRTVHNLIRRGDLVGYSLSGKPGSEYRVAESEVRRFIGLSA